MDITSKYFVVTDRGDIISSLNNEPLDSINDAFVLCFELMRLKMGVKWIITDAVTRQLEPCKKCIGADEILTRYLNWNSYKSTYYAPICTRCSTVYLNLDPEKKEHMCRCGETIIDITREGLCSTCSRPTEYGTDRIKRICTCKTK